MNCAQKKYGLLIYFPYLGVCRNPTDRNNQKPVRNSTSIFAIIHIGQLSRQTLDMDRINAKTLYFNMYYVLQKYFNIS